jgi:hypothetical protein
MTFTEFLKRIPALNLALSGAAVALTKTVLQQRLIPDNLNWLTPAGILVSIIAFLCVFARVIPPRAKTLLIVAGFVSLISLIAMQIRLVEDFDFYGESYHELRGWKLSPNGEEMKTSLEQEFGRKLATYDVIKYSGHTEMFPLFGANWYLSSALYAGSFLAFLFSVIAVAGRFELDAKGS